MSSDKIYRYQSVLLALLWLSGAVKPFLLNYIGSIDLTLIMMLLALLDMALHYRNFSPNKDFIQGLILLFLFYSIMAVSLSYSPSYGYKYEKMVAFFANIIYFLYPVFVKEVQLKSIVMTYLVVLIPTSIFFVSMTSILWSSGSDSVTAFMDLRSNYLSIGFNLGLLFLILYHQKKILWLQFLSFFLLIASAARGALIFTIALLVVDMFVRYSKKSEISWNSYFLSFTGLIGAILIFNQKIINFFSTSIRRFSSLAEGGDVSSAYRLEMMEFAAFTPFSNHVNTLKMIFGYGIGSFGITFYDKDVRAYPHNIFLETFYELGLLGLVLFIMIKLRVLYSLRLKTSIFSLLYLFALLNAMKSGSLSDLWIYFSLASLVLLDKKYSWS
ncbi:O-antigen ligase family protein [Robertkochia flava]|uniref:O-antigen ligase family protein n=1 Tax=Robertkochia flava TaxID=3447986 RepID=UPI001CC95659|nr:O-antigen ligase family protein [Robertkochia marina]